MQPKKWTDKFRELYEQNPIALRCEREELGCIRFAEKYDIRDVTMRDKCPVIYDRSNTINKHIQRGVTYTELRKMGYSDRYIVQKLQKCNKPIIIDKVEEPPRPVHREYVPYWMDDSVVDPDRPLHNFIKNDKKIRTNIERNREK